MGVLTIGRVGLDLDMEHPSKWQESRGLEEREMVVSGFLKSTTANAKILRSELLEMQGQLIAVTYSLDSHFDGFFILGDVRIDTQLGSYKYGFFPYEIGLFRIGSESRTEFVSNVTGTVLVNSHGLDIGEVKPIIAPPIGHLAFGWDATATLDFTRATEDGTIKVYYSNDGDFSEDAVWGADPNTYYSGSCDLFVESRLRSGLDVPNNPGDWSIDNGLIRIGPEAGNTGRIEVECYGGAVWESLNDWAFARNSIKHGGWDFFSVSRNSPESVIIRLQEGGATVFERHTVDLQIRRGFPFLLGVWTIEGNSDLEVVFDAGSGGGGGSTAVTPSGASGNVGIRQTGDDGDGNRFVLFSPQTHTNDLTNGGVEVLATQQIRFALGYSIGGAAAAANDTPDLLALQYHAIFGERVRAVWR